MEKNNLIGWLAFSLLFYSCYQIYYFASFSLKYFKIGKNIQNIFVVTTIYFLIEFL